MRPISTHDRFFSSLNQVEKRLASEKQPIPIPTPSSPISFTSPLYLSSFKPQPSPFPPDETSAPPSDFLSANPSPEQHPRSAKKSIAEQVVIDDDDDDDDDEINSLINLLGLSTDGENEEGLSSCHCSGGGFYRKTVGLKGPMCGRELDRLDGWIQYYSRDGREPARLAHLLLAKAVSTAEGGGMGDDDDGFWGIGFPSTVEDFLEHDPPLEKCAKSF